MSLSSNSGKSGPWPVKSALAREVFGLLLHWATSPGYFTGPLAREVGHLLHWPAFHLAHILIVNQDVPKWDRYNSINHGR